MALSSRGKPRNPVPATVLDAGTTSAVREPMAHYRELRQKGLLQPDPAQQLGVERLQSLYRALLHYRPETGFLGWLARFGLSENGGDQIPVGLYLCGPVGRGKSMLMDLFFAAVPARISGASTSMPSCSKCTTVSNGSAAP